MDNKMDKKLEIKRLVIYLFFAFATTWTIFFLTYYCGEARMWGERPKIDQMAALGMLCPTIAMLLTRFVTKEGFSVTGEGSMLLGISFKNRKWIWYIVAMLLPWIYLEIGHALYLLVNKAAFDANSPSIFAITENGAGIIYLIPIAGIISGTLGSFAAFGEEAGWRGYMMPKLINIMGMNKAVIVGGIIWGMWHWPLTCVGHNFGDKYFGFPYTGCAMMCILSIFMGIILTFITIKSESIWPAAILHAVNNASPSILGLYINEENLSGWRGDTIFAFVLTMLPMIAVATFFVSHMSRRKKTYPIDFRTITS